MFLEVKVFLPGCFLDINSFSLISPRWYFFQRYAIEVCDLSLDQPYKDKFDKLMLKLMGDYPDQAREILDQLIERAVLSLPYIENTREYPFHLWVKIT